MFTARTLIIYPQENIPHSDLNVIQTNHKNHGKEHIFFLQFNDLFLDYDQNLKQKYAE